MNSFERSCLLIITLAGLCSCVHTSPKPVVMEDANAFVYIAAVHAVPIKGEPQPDAWDHAHSILDAAGIRNFMESFSGVVSIYVEPDRTNEASLLLFNDAVARGYWMHIASIRMEGGEVNFSNMPPYTALEPTAIFAYQTPTNLANQISRADHIIVTNLQYAGFSLILSGDMAKKIVRAISSGRCYAAQMDPGYACFCELQFYTATNHLATVSFLGGGFVDDGQKQIGSQRQIYNDETGVLAELYQKLIARTSESKDK
jgi:hypothetical protein